MYLTHLSLNQTTHKLYNSLKCNFWTNGIDNTASLTKLLRQQAPSQGPKYSSHHDRLSIDMGWSWGSKCSFKSTKCYEWITLVYPSFWDIKSDIWTQGNLINVRRGSWWASEKRGQKHLLGKSWLPNPCWLFPVPFAIFRRNFSSRTLGSRCAVQTVLSSLEALRS